MRAYVGAVREQAPDLGVTDILGITPEQGFAAFAQIPTKFQPNETFGMEGKR